MLINKNDILISCDSSYFEDTLKDYFDLSTDYSYIKSIADKDVRYDGVAPKWM